MALTLVGYLLGGHQEGLRRYLHVISLSCVGVAFLIAAGYAAWLCLRRRASKAAGPGGLGGK